VAALGTGLAFALGGRNPAAAAALGGLACLLPSAWFAWRVFGADPSDPNSMLGAMYLGEAVKLAAIALAFAAIFRFWPDVPALPLVLTFIAVQTVHWFAPLLVEQ
jgi:ATP synthase protein I